MLEYLARFGSEEWVPIKKPTSYLRGYLLKNKLIEQNGSRSEFRLTDRGRSALQSVKSAHRRAQQRRLDSHE